MLYIVRNPQGEIADIEFSPGANREEISLYDDELKRFISQSPESEAMVQRVLNRLDMDMVRVIEDVVDMLLKRELIRFTDLPEAVQNKLMFKKNIRNLSNVSSIIEDEEMLNF